MKIIKHGTPPDGDRFRGNCRHCKSEIEAMRSELTVKYDQREHGELAQIACPVCKGDMWVYPVKQ